MSESRTEPPPHAQCNCGPSIDNEHSVECVIRRNRELIEHLRAENGRLIEALERAKRQAMRLVNLLGGAE